MNYTYQNAQKSTIACRRIKDCNNGIKRRRLGIKMEILVFRTRFGKTLDCQNLNFTDRTWKYILIWNCLSFIFFIITVDCLDLTSLKKHFMDRSKRSLKSRWRIPVSIEMSMGVHYNTFNVISHHVILSNSAPKMNLYSLFPKLQGLEMISDESRRNHSSKSMSVIRFLSMSKGFDFCNKAEN